MSLLNFLRGKFDPIYYKNNPIWLFIPPSHRPEGSRPKRDDWPILKSTPRTATSFILFGYEFSGTQTHWIRNIIGGQELDKVSISKDPLEGWVPQPWPLRGQWQKTKVKFMDPVIGTLHTRIYYARTLKNGKAFRFGARISTDESGFYVNMILIRFLGTLLTFGTKDID